MWIRAGSRLNELPAHLCELLGLVPCSGVHPLCSEGVLAPRPAAKTPLKFCMHGDLNEKVTREKIPF